MDLLFPIALGLLLIAIIVVIGYLFSALSKNKIFQGILFSLIIVFSSWFIGTIAMEAWSRI